MKPLSVHFGHTVPFSAEAVEAYCKYHRLQPSTKKASLVKHIRSVLDSLGTDGIEVHIQEGMDEIEAEATEALLADDERTAQHKASGEALAVEVQQILAGDEL